MNSDLKHRKISLICYRNLEGRKKDEEIDYDAVANFAVLGYRYLCLGPEPNA